MYTDLAAKYMNVRVRLQCYKSARFTFGWINYVGNNEFGVEFVERELGTVGNRYHVELNDGSNLVMADALLTQCDGVSGRFMIDSPIRTASPTMGLRLRSRLDAEIVHKHERYQAIVVDLSDDGMGVVTNVKADRMDYVQTSICLDRGVLNVVGRVVYCRALVEGKWDFRLGLYVPQLNQLIDPEEGNLRKVHLDPCLAA